MRFFSDGPAIPDNLLDRRDNGLVVFLCGAGVSKNSGLPSFVELAKYVIESLHPPKDFKILNSFQPCEKEYKGSILPLDQIFNFLHQVYGKDRINSLVTERLMKQNVEPERIGYEHSLIRKISSDINGCPQIVTTNFDKLFESNDQSDKIPIHVPPSLPIFDTSINGITYLHGRIADKKFPHAHYVLSSADFGQAYLSEGWATNFVKNLLHRYTVVLVGYQAEDPPINYLLQGLNLNQQNNQYQLFSFDKGKSEEIEAKWRDRGVTTIAYKDHPQLWETMRAWADRAEDPHKWRKTVISTVKHDPKKLAPHERGKVVHLLRTNQGAKIFSEMIQPNPHPEWICVLDTELISSYLKRNKNNDSNLFDPQEAYGLDSILLTISDNEYHHGYKNGSLLVSLPRLNNPNDFHRLVGPQDEGNKNIPKRLLHLCMWIGKSIHSPVMAWWVARQSGLHPSLLNLLINQVSISSNLNKKARKIWNLIIEHHRTPNYHLRKFDWFDLNKRIAIEGWTASVLREFRKVSQPQIHIQHPLDCNNFIPPTKDWENINLSDVCRFEVSFPDFVNEEDLEVPDEVLLQVFDILVYQLIVVSGLLSDIEKTFYISPTCYPGREMNSVEHSNPNVFRALKLIRQLFDRIVILWPEKAQVRVKTWPEEKSFYFHKLKLYALSKTKVFNSRQVVETVLTLEQDVFWDLDVARELLFLLVDRWLEFSQKDRVLLAERILNGPEKRPNWSDEDFLDYRNKFIASYGRYIELKRLALPEDCSERLYSIISKLPDWNDRWAISMITGGHFTMGWVKEDETPNGILDLPVNKVIAKVKELQEREPGSFTARRPFKGLVKENPRKALASLTLESKAGAFPQRFWEELINGLPDDVSSRLKRVFLHRLKQLPDNVVVDLRFPLTSWLKNNLKSTIEFDDELGWSVYDHIVEGIVCANFEATNSSIIEMPQKVKEVKSRRTLFHAINNPIGKCSEALHSVIPDPQGKDSQISEALKTRFNKLIEAPGEGSDHAVSICMSELNRLIFVDYKWTKDRLIPMLDPKHPASEPAWNGFLHVKLPSPSLAQLIKPRLMNLYPWIEKFSWDIDLTTVPGKWLGNFYIFKSDHMEIIPKSEMRNTLRKMSDEVRSQFIWWLGKVGQKNENGWVDFVVPFIQDVWPKERQYQTSMSVKAWIDILGYSGDSFPIVYDAVKQFLSCIEMKNQSLYRFTRGENPIMAKFPKHTLDLLYSVTFQDRDYLSFSHFMPEILEAIAETDPDLLNDKKYKKLSNLIEQS